MGMLLQIPLVVDGVPSMNPTRPLHFIKRSKRISQAEDDL
jgi:hypothetical protein